MNRFDNKVAIITGGGGAIGSATARRLVSEGAAVALFDMHRDNTETVAADIRKAGGKALAVVGDILSKSDIERALAATLQEFGRLDILVNNAATCTKATIAEIDEEDWDRDVDGTLKGAFLVSRAVLPGMVAKKKGVIVNIGSVNGLMYFGNPAYCAGKGGLISLTQSIATEYGKHGVRCAMVSPGTIRTNTASWTRRLERDPHVFEKLTRWYPVGRVGLPDDIAAAVAYLASDDAAFVSGSNLVVDGGLTAGMGIMTDELLAEREK